MTENHTIYSAAAVANWFIDKNIADPTDLTHLKIQKLLYYAQGWHLGNYEIPLFEDDIEAWQHGPVIRSIYLALRGYKRKIITNHISGPEIINGEFNTGFPNIHADDELRKEFLSNYWNIYAKIDAWKLVNFTHQNDTPWSQIYNAFGLQNVIPKELIMSYFKTLVAKIN